MTDLTSARLRDAAATQRLLVTRYGLAAKRAFDHAELDGYADRLEHEQAKREKRIAELIDELAEMIYGCEIHWASDGHRRAMNDLAARLLDRYPALLESTDD